MKMIKEYLKKRFNDSLKKINSEEGFSLIELMIVITIIGILAIVVVPKFMDMPKKARVAKAKDDIKNIGMALDRYNLDNGSYPTTEQGIAALVEKPSSDPVPNNWNEGGYLQKRSAPKDPWGHDFVYTSPGESGADYDLMSYGADGQEGGSGEDADIKSGDL